MSQPCMNTVMNFGFHKSSNFLERLSDYQLSIIKLAYLGILLSSRNEAGASFPSCKVNISCMCVVPIPHSCNTCTLTKQINTRVQLAY
jgi:hypothetical protein